MANSPALTVRQAARALSFLLAATTVLTAGVPSAFAAIHVVCGTERRALSIALLFFFANLVGLGLGPVITGVLSDALAAGHGSGEGLRLALMIIMTLLLPAGWLMLRAAKHLRGDAED